MVEADSPKDLIDRIDGALARGERVALVGIVAVMVGLSGVQAFLRFTFDIGFEWADIIVRQMVLWLAFVGGALATHHGRHIAIDAAGKFLSEKGAAWLRAVTSLCAAGITVVLIVAAQQFVSDEISNGTKLVADLPAWPFQLIIPASFTAMTIHFLVTARNAVLVALGRRALAPVEEGM